MCDLDGNRDSDADILIQSVPPKFRPIFERYGYDQEHKRSIYRYLFSRRPQNLPPSIKNRLISLYDPMADRSKKFRDGLRWCINVYVGCRHNCSYCYVNGYSQESVGIRPHSKRGFEAMLMKDIHALKSFGVPRAPVHLSNSTDPCQEHLELENRHTQFTLQKILENRSLFSSVILLTKNPQLLCDERHLGIICRSKMLPFTVQITCAFWREDSRMFYEPHAPSVDSRLQALRVLAENGIEVELRIDPLFPSSRIDRSIRRHRALPSYSIPEAQTQDDLVNLIRFAGESGAKAIVAKTLKVPISKKAQRCKDCFAEIYRDADPDRERHLEGGSWRLPQTYQDALLSTVSDICDQEGIPFRHCIQNVLSRK